MDMVQNWSRLKDGTFENAPVFIWLIAKLVYYYEQNQSYSTEFKLNVLKIIAKEYLSLMATDMAEFNVLRNKLYLSPIIDLFNQEIISF